MNVLWARILSLLLALVVGGAAVACPCISPSRKDDAGRTAKCHECEGKTKPAQKQSETCEGCRIVTGVQKASIVDLTPTAIALFSPALLNDDARPQFPLGSLRIEQSQAPPLWSDLVHTSCQLTI